MQLQNLTKQPTMFGCNDSAPVPLVLYLPNAPWTHYSNFSYQKPAFTDAQFEATVGNAFNVATYGNGTVDPEWPQCVACAAIRGALLRAGQQIPDQCAQCFQRHCWNGTNSTGEVTAEDFNLRPRLNESLTYAEENRTLWSVGSSERGGSGSGTSGSPGGNGGSSGGSGGSSGSASDANAVAMHGSSLMVSVLLATLAFSLL